MKRIHVLIDGKVQGVFYRSSLQQEAKTHGIAGWTRNLPDGKVEALLEGEDQQVAAVLEWIWKGPPRAVVRKVEWTEEAYRGESQDFTIRY